MEREQTALRRPPHPMPGLLAVIPLPNPEQEDGKDDPGTQKVTVAGLGEFLVLDLRRRQPGIAAGVVIEVGPIPPNMVDEEFSAPYGEGATVFYAEAHGVVVGEFTFVPVDRVLAWEEVPA